MEIRNDAQLSLDFENQAHADGVISATVEAVDRPRLHLVYSSNEAVQRSADEHKILEGILSHARSLSW